MSKSQSPETAFAPSGKLPAESDADFVVLNLFDIFSGYLIAPHGHCLIAVNGGGVLGTTAALSTDATTPGAYGIFPVLEQDDSTYALLTAGGFYVSATDGGAMNEASGAKAHHPIVVSERRAFVRSKFHISQVGDKQIVIGTPDRKHYVTAVNGGGVGGVGPITTVAKQIGPNEKFNCFLETQTKTHTSPTRIPGHGGDSGNGNGSKPTTPPKTGGTGNA